jgi:S1-C subfamily serine protease
MNDFPQLTAQEGRSWWIRHGPALTVVIAVGLLLAGVAGLLWQYWPWRGPDPLYDPAAKPREVVPRGGLLPEEIANNEVYEKAWKSVVSITTLDFRRDPATFDLEEVPQGAGSGIIWNEKGYVVTNYHVIQDARAAAVVLWDGSTLKARAVGVAPDKDLAVLKIDAADGTLFPIEVGASKDLKVGQKAFAIGNPFGLGHSFTEGVISALQRRIKSVTGRPIDGVLQTSAPINPGNSGGPLLDSAGRLIGVNTAIYSPSGASAGIGFAIPVDTVNEVVPELIRRGKVERPGLGVQIANATVSRRLGIKSGVLIVEVLPNGAAARAGMQGTRMDTLGRVLRLGDIIVAVEGKPVVTADDLFEQLTRRKVGDTVRVTVLRGSDRQEIDIKLEAI